MADLASRPYIKFSADIESIPPGEKDDIQAVADMINTMQKQQFNNHRHCYGGTHARTQGLVKGTFVVSDDLPAHLKQGELFAQGGTYPCAARYSTELGDPGLDDRIAQPRGFAMKIFNVHGDFFEEGKENFTQDIEFNSEPAIELADAKTAKEVFELRLQYAQDKEKLYKAYEKRDDTDLQKARDQVYNTHLESTRQYSQTAYRFGNYVMKFALTPSTQTQKDLHYEQVRGEHGSDVLHRWLQSFHENNEAEYDLQVQLLEDLDEQPIEYAGTPWDEAKYPFQTIAKVKFPKQDSFDYTRKSFWEDHLRMDPFLGLKAYQPLGSPNRLRRVVYPASSKLRRKMNGRAEIHVKHIDDIP